MSPFALVVVATMTLLGGLAPAADADSMQCDSPPLTSYCVGGSASGSEGCDAPGSSGYRENAATVFMPFVLPLQVRGYASCTNFAGDHCQGRGVGVTNSGIGVEGVEWDSRDCSASGPSCDMTAFVSLFVAVDQGLGCPAGAPPDPGWGHLGLLP